MNPNVPHVMKYKRASCHEVQTESGKVRALRYFHCCVSGQNESLVLFWGLQGSVYSSTCYITPHFQRGKVSVDGQKQNKVEQCDMHTTQTEYHTVNCEPLTMAFTFLTYIYIYNFSVKHSAGYNCSSTICGWSVYFKVPNFHKSGHSGLLQQSPPIANTVSET